LTESFKDTWKRYFSIPELWDAILISQTNQYFIGEAEPLFDSNESVSVKPAVRVTRRCSLEIALSPDFKGKKICVLNFASVTNPGGGVTRGSNAQEECLCRCSTLYECLRAALYEAHKEKLRDGMMTALYSDDCKYTPDVVVFKSDGDLPEPLPVFRWTKIDVISCPRLDWKRRATSTAHGRPSLSTNRR